jgi:hypothetical protein
LTPNQDELYTFQECVQKVIAETSSRGEKIERPPTLQVNRSTMISGLLTCTKIYDNDLADQILNRKKNPYW